MSQARFEVLEQLDQLEEIVLEGARVPFADANLFTALRINAPIEHMRRP